MKTLPNDICRCLGIGCHEYETCLRYIAHKTDDRSKTYSYMMFGAVEYTETGAKCKDKIEDKPND